MPGHQSALCLTGSPEPKSPLWDRKRPLNALGGHFRDVPILLQNSATGGWHAIIESWGTNF